MNEDIDALKKLSEIKIDKKFSIEDGERRRYKYAEGEDWEILLMVWGINAKTPIHNHNGSKGWIRMLEGKLLEICFDHVPIFQKQAVLASGNDAYIDDHKGTHQILNPFETVALSLHLYSPPISKCSIFDHKSHEWRNQEMLYDFVSEAVLL